MALYKYLPDTCYTCQKYLYYFKPSLRISCTCPKEEWRTKDKTSQQGQQIYQRICKPNQPISRANKFLFNANNEFSYESDFEESFSYMFCSIYNSKNQRLRNKDKEFQAKKDDVLVVLDDSSKELDVNNFLSSKGNDGVNSKNDDGCDNKDNNKDNGEIDDVGDDNNYDDSDKNEDNNDYGKDENEKNDNDEIKVQIIVKSKTKVSPAKILSIQPINYYNTLNSRSLFNILEDELDFDEFIKDLIKEEKLQAEVIFKLYEKYKCDFHITPCYVENNRHLQLNPARLQLWAQDILNKGSTYEVPPSYSTFNIKLGVFANKNNSSQIFTISAAINPIVIQFSSQLYSNQEYLTSYSLNIQASSPGNLPSISEFLHSLNQKYNYDNVYSKFENSFLDEEITVNVIKDLSDEQLTKLGVVKIGWQKNIKQAAQRF
ncbi:hypothetical protein GLOIN_2v1473341 [Rhizophagus clarus]|uniref:SAM domain-containing protein n=1 Tax=Rhizophagus clarus TaxID=94130 RepID=A0A8H3QCE3_9GLOM|nr:hypothetical protein GLOIN_2v1473341 [Rhizophagus clarus]